MKKFNYLAIVLMAFVFAGCPDSQNSPCLTETNAFSVSEYKKVCFSKGNLQYHPLNDEWRFAPNQTDYIGEVNTNISSNYNSWIDLFAWGTGANPVDTTRTSDNYQIFVDWGEMIKNSDTINNWRTLTDKEWHYLRYLRNNADDLYGVAQVDGVNGLVLLPDNWKSPRGIQFKSGLCDKWGMQYSEKQILTKENWLKLEQNGAIFLPASGIRNGTYVFKVQERGCYWLFTEYDIDRAWCLEFESNSASSSRYYRYLGLSVRLVKDL